TSRPLTFHVHGLFYDKSSEGAPYDDGDGFNPGDRVPPGAQHIYTFVVTPRAGPGPADGSSILWMYHSHVDEPMDTNSGLVGPIIVTAAGKATESGRPVDVEREFVMLFSIFNENDSWMLNRNLQDFTGLDSVSRATTIRKLTEDPEFQESNLMHSINGYVYGNLGFDPRWVPGQYPPAPAGAWPDVLRSVTMVRGERVRWYLMGLGTEVDIHTPHWHGQTGLYAGMRTDVVELLPASMKVFDMVPDNPGAWLFHCHVNDHIVAGMTGRFQVD
ncbi:MAG TPA: multicopper oxidase domain-containing protein, partial [Longimicrobiaceae bacterium]